MASFGEQKPRCDRCNEEPPLWVRVVFAHLDNFAYDTAYRDVRVSRGGGWTCRKFPGPVERYKWTCKACSRYYLSLNLEKGVVERQLNLLVIGEEMYHEIASCGAGDEQEHGRLDAVLIIASPTYSAYFGGVRPVDHYAILKRGQIRGKSLLGWLTPDTDVVVSRWDFGEDMEKSTAAVRARLHEKYGKDRVTAIAVRTGRSKWNGALLYWGKGQSTWNIPLAQRTRVFSRVHALPRKYRFGLLLFPMLLPAILLGAFFLFDSFPLSLSAAFVLWIIFILVAIPIVYYLLVISPVQNLEDRLDAIKHGAPASRSDIMEMLLKDDLILSGLTGNASMTVRQAAADALAQVESLEKASAEGPLNAVIIIFTRDFSPKETFVNSILKKMNARGRSYSEWMKENTPMHILVNPKAQDPMTFAAIGMVQFRRLIGDKFDLDKVEHATFEGSDGISGVILTSWNN